MNIDELVKKSMINTNDERPTEYRFIFIELLPFLFLKEKDKIKILDVGGAESLLSKTLADLGFDVYVIDINDLDYGKAKFIKENILNYDFPNNFFDIIIAISTIEHIGLSCYNQKILDNDGDIKTMEKIYKWLKPGGIALITLPYGKPHRPPDFERVYNKETLKSRILKENWFISKIEFYAKFDIWKVCQEEETYDKDGVVLLNLKK
jgi:2-polyprenyl-3-methyl-5-hydroxy-6-metoxy-1,4-benzoquinol methylase